MKASDFRHKKWIEERCPICARLFHQISFSYYFKCGSNHSPSISGYRNYDDQIQELQVIYPFGRIIFFFSRKESVQIILKGWQRSDVTEINIKLMDMELTDITEDLVKTLLIFK